MCVEADIGGRGSGDSVAGKTGLWEFVEREFGEIISAF